MATRRRTTRRRTSTRRSTTYRRTRYRATRRRPKLATALGTAFALGMIALWTQATWPWRIGVTAALLGLYVVYYLWSRRGDIYDEMQVRRADEERRARQDPGGDPR